MNHTIGVKPKRSLLFWLRKRATKFIYLNKKKKLTPEMEDLSFPVHLETGYQTQSKND